MVSSPLYLLTRIAPFLLLAAAAPAQDPFELGVPSAPGPAPLDRFHPDTDEEFEPPPPRRGGQLTVHLSSRPRSFNYMLESSAITRQLLYELHEPLIRRDWETWEWRGVLAKRWKTSEDGLEWTFNLRDDVVWHDGHPFDAHDVRFTWSLWKNPDVRCDRRRYMFDKVVACEVLDEARVRFTFDTPYFMAASAFDESFTVLPAHLYDLSDPDNPDHADEVDPTEQARYVNEHPRNLDWIGLGPYRLETADTQVIEARRFEGYFDEENGGWVDSIRWRVIASSEAATQALFEGELDFLDRLSSEDYSGARTSGDAFKKRFYKGYYFTPYMGYTAWNTKRAKLSDPRVRRALGMCFDWSAFVRTYYADLAFRVVGDQWYPSPTYDRSIRPLPFDTDAARALLAEAGWYDRDGDGVADREGEALEIELLMPSGNAVSSAFGQLFQESLEEAGVRLVVAAQDFASLRERVLERDFDALALGSVLAFDSDPEQLWHSRWSTGSSSNRSGLSDEGVDELIETIQRELDEGARTALFHRLQQRIHELQPFQFGVCAPHRFALSRRVRGVQIFALDPGYSLRRWFVTD